ncbi:hypothetical protein AAHN93_02660 [Vandammella animalimorsus]|uniref:Uncharacterized protein n=2 Tax=Vandammella animalimorsus TaxID=2029117 RepID=A0A2A2AZD4_9BURK|nr:hypothetical protein [Vandammella animalimorsus]PAT43133.1 hypothetical protein CK621_06285 [Vandammella animalimorsus]
MRLIVLTIIALCLVLGIKHWRQSRDPLAHATASAQGFVSVPMPDGAQARTVLIFTPRNCPSDWAQRAQALADALAREGIPAQRSSHYRVSMVDPTPEQEQALQRFTALSKQPGPLVLINGQAKANPSADEVIAQYRSDH